MKIIKTKPFIVLMVIFLVFLVLGSTGASFGEKLYEKHGVRTIDVPKYVPDEIIVKFKSGVSEDVIDRINQGRGTSILSVSKQGRFLRLRIPWNKTVKEMVAIYEKNPNVEYAEPNFIASALLGPDDEYYPYQWHFDNEEYGGINMESAWDIQTGDPGVIVAVIDTGVAYENFKRIYKKAPDLANTSFVAGYDFVNNDSHPNDDEGHGTHVAGTIAQSTNNGLGVAGIAFNTSIMPIKVLDRNGSGTYADIANGIYFAADNGASVINLSLGGTSPSTTLEDSLAYAYGKGVTIICAAGNEYLRGNSPLYPAAYDAYCIAVGATRYDEERAYYSNTGSYLDITAPGGDLTVDQNGDGYGDGVLQQTFGNNPRDFGYWFYQGTSMAAPHVAGVAALVIANRVTGPDNVREVLEATAEDKGIAGWDPAYGYGIVNAYAALNYLTEPVHDVAITVIDAPLEAYQGDLVSISVTVENQGTYSETTTVSLTDTIDGELIGSQSVTLDAGGSNIISFKWNTSEEALGDHVLTAEASPVLDETNTDDNSRDTTVNIKEKVTATMHVDAIDMSLSTRTAGPNEFTKALATVTIVDKNGVSVEGATVYGAWSGATSDTDSEVTDSQGEVTLESDQIKNASGGTTFTFTVDDVTKSGWTYLSGSNTETSDLVDIP